jgi:hypothetical protein
MIKEFLKPENADFDDILEYFSALSDVGYCGASMDDEFVKLFFEKQKLTASEDKKIQSLIDKYIPKASIKKIREIRKPLLEEADWKFNKAIDEDDLELRAKIKEYRKQLRDITLQDRSKLMWPEKPWE